MKRLNDQRAAPLTPSISTMALPLKAFSVTLLLLAVVLPYRHAHAQHQWRHAVQHVVDRHHHTVAPTKHHKPKFKPGPWKLAHATFYSGDSTSFGGACGYEDVDKEGYGIGTVALSTALFNNGQTCGACYEIKCSDNPQWCKPSEPSLFVTATNLCPPNFYQSTENGGWCNPPREHFDIAFPAFSQIAEYKAGVIPINYRRVPCQKQGGIRFTITGNPYFNLVAVWNVGGAGDVISMQVKGNKNLKWTKMTRNWGQKWQTNAMLSGESLTFRVQASDGRFSTSWQVAPKNWQFGQTFEGKNFR